MDISEIRYSYRTKIHIFQISDMSRQICPFLAMDISEMDISVSYKTSPDDVRGIGNPIYPFPISCFSVIPPFLLDPHIAVMTACPTKISSRCLVSVWCPFLLHLLGQKEMKKNGYIMCIWLVLTAREVAIKSCKLISLYVFKELPWQSKLFLSICF